MTSTVDNNNLLVVIASLVTALTSASSVSTMAMGASIANQLAGDTGLTTQQIGLLNQMALAMSSQPAGSTSASCPSSVINSYLK